MKKESNPRTETPTTYEIGLETVLIVSGSFTTKLYAALLDGGVDTDEVAVQLDAFYENDQHTALFLFVCRLANLCSLTLPDEFFQLAIHSDLAPLLAEAIIDDWSEYSDDDFLS